MALDLQRLVLGLFGMIAVVPTSLADEAISVLNKTNQSSSSEMIRIPIKGFKFESEPPGKPLRFKDSQLTGVVTNSLGPDFSWSITEADLETARRAITEHYIRNGYLNSGAVLPDQDLEDGIEVFKIIEG